MNFIGVARGGAIQIFLHKYVCSSQRQTNIKCEDREWQCHVDLQAIHNESTLDTQYASNRTVSV